MKTTIAIILVIIIGWYLFNKEETSEIMTLQLTSSSFEHNASIPSQYTCDGNRTPNPPLSIRGVSSEAKSLALIVDDPDVPKQLRPDGVFDHWVLFNIPAETKEIPEGADVGTLGLNSAGNNAYTGPCPPPEYEPAEHRYIFKLYALDTIVNLPEGASKQELLEAMQDHILQEAELIGKYQRQ